MKILVDILGGDTAPKNMVEGAIMAMQQDPQLTCVLVGDENYEDALYFYHGNHLSSTQLVTDMYGAVQQAVLYTPWGMTISEYRQDWMMDTIPRYLFSGKEKDAESGLNYFEARYYSDEDMVFRGRDQKFEKYFWTSPYTYCLNNPVIYIDPDGRDVMIAFTGGFTGGGKAVAPNSTAAAYTGKIFQSIANFAQQNGIDFKGTVIASGLTSKSSVKTAMDFIKNNYTEGEKLIIYGYSNGGDFAVELSEALQAAGITVDLLITVDAADSYLGGRTVNSVIPDNVKENQNYYQETPSRIRSRGNENTAQDPSKTDVMNINMIGDDINHGNMPQKTAPQVREDIQRVLTE